MAFVFEGFEEPLAEPIAIVHRELCDTIEGSLGFGALHTRNTVETIHQHIAALPVFADHLAEIGRWRGQCRFRGELSERWRAQTRLCELQDGRHHLLVPADDRPDTSTAHAVALAHTVDEDHVPVDPLQVQRAHVFCAIVTELAVHLVSEQKEVVLLHNVPETQ